MDLKSNHFHKTNMEKALSDLTKLTWGKIVFCLGYALSGLVYYPFAQWVTTTRIGTSLFLWGSVFYSLPLFAAVLGLPVLMVAICLHDWRKKCLFLLVFSVVLIPCHITGLLLGQKIRIKGMEACGSRAQPLVNAIKRFELDHGKPPDALEALVPDYLPHVPSTGMMAYPKFRYHSGPEAEERYEGNNWALSIFTPNAGINFDMMLYFPQQNYPTIGYGGSLERLGDWAYVHE